jgi:hypothetical protein
VRWPPRPQGSVIEERRAPPGAVVIFDASGDPTPWHIDHMECG